jgi:extracellular elastinolytic metalloproteinase
MTHNWYETTVTTAVPHRIISVVDWWSDSPMPMSVAGQGECGLRDCESLIVNVPLTTAGQLPNLGAFVPPGSNYDSVASAPVRGLGKTLSGKMGECIVILQFGIID